MSLLGNLNLGVEHSKNDDINNNLLDGEPLFSYFNICFCF